MRRLFIFLIIGVLTITLSGCSDLSETNDMVYAVAIGIDKGTENNYEITLQYARVFEINSGAESGEGDAKILDTVSVNAPSIYSAVELANHFISKSFVMSHIKLIVFSKEVASEGLSDFAELFARNSDFRPHVYMAVSNGGAKEYLESVKPSIEINPVKYYDLIYNNEGSVYVPRFDLHEFCNYFNSSERDIVMPLAAAVSEENESLGTENRNKNGFEYDTDSYLAGEKKREAKNPSEVVGMAVFANDRLAGVMGSRETELYNMLSGGFTMNYTTFHNPVTNKPITVKMIQEKKPYIRVSLTEEKPKVDIDLYFESEFVGLPDEYYYENDLESFENTVNGYIKAAAEEFLKSTQTDFNSDVLGIGTYIKRKFRTYQEYKQYGFEKKYQDVEFNVNVEYKLRRTGLVIRET